MSYIDHISRPTATFVSHTSFFLNNSIVMQFLTNTRPHQNLIRQSIFQLQVLKDATVLPVTAHQCGLITKSDAERLCSHLLDKSPPRASVFDPKSSPFSFKVQHECFGRCEGLVLPEAYTSPSARCIECLQCEGLFSPQKFVCHSHSPENRTCHWGFDSSNWLTYLQVDEHVLKRYIICNPQ
jgi:hypothetical protein